MILRIPTFFFLTLSLLSAGPYGLSPQEQSEVAFPEKLPTIRYFPRWDALEPTRNQWDFTSSDELLKTATGNGTTIHAVLHHPPAWAGSQNSSSVFPLADTRAWGAFVRKTVARYPGIIRWDVLESYNTGAMQIHTPLQYVELLTIAKQEAEAANPEATIGFCMAGFDLEFLDQALRSGAGRQFDYLSIASYDYPPGSADHFATLLPTLRKLLESHKLPASLPVFITIRAGEKELSTVAPLALSLGFEGVFLNTDAASLEDLPTKLSEPLPPPPSFADAESVSLTLGEASKPGGIIQTDPRSTPWDAESGANRLHISGQPPSLSTAFLAAPDFATPENQELEISFEVRRIPDADDNTNPTGFSLIYESTHGTRSADGFRPVPGDNQWHTLSWKLTDAKFQGVLGWNFRIDATGAGNDLLIRRVTVTK